MTNPDRTVATARYRETHAALHANQRAEQAAGIDYETDTYLELNAAADAAAKNPDLPWYLRSR